MQHQDMRTPTEIFDDMLADDKSLDEIGFRLGWSNYSTHRQYRQICMDLGEAPDVV